MPTPKGKSRAPIENTIFASPGEIEELLTSSSSPIEPTNAVTSDSQNATATANATKPLLDILEAFSGLAELEEGLGAFDISDFNIEPVVIEPTLESTQQATLGDTTQCIPIYKKDIDPPLRTSAPTHSTA
jgi:hypothetical protein